MVDTIYPDQIFYSFFLSRNKTGLKDSLEALTQKSKCSEWSCNVYIGNFTAPSSDYQDWNI